MNFINIPLSIAFDKSPVIEREGGDIEMSIDNILDLIIFTPKGSFDADPEFGFEYWNHEFSNINVREFNNNYLGLMSGVSKGDNISRKQCEESIRESILTYEPRLQQPEVKVELDESTSNYQVGNKRPKYEMHVVITGAIDIGLGISRQYEKRVSFMVEPIVCKISI